MHERTSLWKGLALVGTAALLSGCITINLLPGAGPLEEKQLSGSGTYKVLMVELSGLISSRESEGLVEQPNPVAHLKEELTRAANDSKVKALVVRINSPGGTVTASDVLYHELRAFKEKRKIPVIASIMDVGASGGYYVAVAADKIMAHPSSVTGSLGVIMLTVNARGLLEKIGLEATELAKRQAGLTDARVVVYRRPGEYRHNIYSRVLEGGSGWTALSGLDLMAIVRGGTPQFMYLWMP